MASAGLKFLLCMHITTADALQSCKSRGWYNINHDLSWKRKESEVCEITSHRLKQLVRVPGDMFSVISSA